MEAERLPTFSFFGLDLYDHVNYNEKLPSMSVTIYTTLQRLRASSKLWRNEWNTTNDRSAVVSFVLTARDLIQGNNPFPTPFQVSNSCRTCKKHRYPMILASFVRQKQNESYGQYVRPSKPGGYSCSSPYNLRPISPRCMAASCSDFVAVSCIS